MLGTGFALAGKSSGDNNRALLKKDNPIDHLKRNQLINLPKFKKKITLANMNDLLKNKRLKKKHK